jgi:dihydroorotate dehydrogenase electron transfer subunit
MKILQSKDQIIENSRAGENYFKLVLDSAGVSRLARPGQFVMVKVAAGQEILLRRPLGIHGIKGNRLSLLYEVVGKGTEILSAKKPGERVDIVGPLGHGFDFRAGKVQPRPVLAAGGMGVAPLLFLGEKLKVKHPLVLIGARNKKGVLCVKEFKRLGCEVRIATDDGSLGFKGTVSDLLENLIAGRRNQELEIYACGPKAMLRAAALIADKHAVPLQVSLEAHLACGIGACLGCVINTRSGYQRVCKEGPVFDAQEIIWEPVKKNAN